MRALNTKEKKLVTSFNPVGLGYCFLNHAQQRIDSLYFRIDYKATLCKLGEEKEAKNNEIAKA